MDYRSDQLANNDGDPEMRLGLVYDQLLGTILRGFGVQQEEYDRYRARPLGTRGTTEVAPSAPALVGGFGAYSNDQSHDSRYYHEEAVRIFADEPLPGIWIG